MTTLVKVYAAMAVAWLAVAVVFLLTLPWFVAVAAVAVAVASAVAAVLVRRVPRVPPAREYTETTYVGW